MRIGIGGLRSDVRFDGFDRIAGRLGGRIAGRLGDGLRSVGYLPGESTALVSYLAARLGKPVLVEGPAGVGKTELARALSR